MNPNNPLPDKKNGQYPLLISLSLIVAFLHGCTPFQPPAPERVDGSALYRLPPSQYPEFSDDMDYDGLRQGVSQSLAYLNRLPVDRSFRFGPDSYTNAQMKKSLTFFLSLIENRPSPADLNQIIQSHFIVYKSKGRDGAGRVLYTGYYEPTLAGSAKSGPAFPHPLFARPDDLAFVDLSRFNVSVTGKTKIVGRFTAEQTVVPYYERQEIIQNQLNGRAKVIAWVNDPIGLFFLQIQGSGKVLLDSGEVLNVNYDSSNGRSYKSIGALLIEEGKIAREEMSMQRIREYLLSHPQEIDRILNSNPSYVFFRVGKEGPIGCLNVKVTPGRTLALENHIFPAAALAFMTASKPLVDEKGSMVGWEDFSRFVLNQDTGGAIRGPGRADLFWGGGSYAEIAAGHMKQDGELYFLILDPERAGQPP